MLSFEQCSFKTNNKENLMSNKAIMLIGAVVGGIVGFFLKDTLGFCGILFGIIAGAVSADFFYNSIRRK